MQSAALLENSTVTLTSDIELNLALFAKLCHITKVPGESRNKSKTLHIKNSGAGTYLKILGTKKFCPKTWWGQFS